MSNITYIHTSLGGHKRSQFAMGISCFNIRSKNKTGFLNGLPFIFPNWGAATIGRVILDKPNQPLVPTQRVG